MGRFVAGDAPAADGLVAKAVAGIGAAVAALRVPRLDGVVLGGGYGRGEGGAVERKEEEGEGKKEEEVLLSNDLDFFAVTEDGAAGRDVDAIAAALEPVAGEWKAKLGIDVDFAVKTPWRLRHDERRLMVQELVHGYVDVWGMRGEELFSGVARLEPAELPREEAARLLMNRGMGLLLAQEEGRGSGFVARNINKAVLGAGDARLIARGAYRWKIQDRAAALGDPLYSAAMEWKFRPSGEPVCSWEAARGAWLDALRELGEDSGDAGRSVFNAVRWLARRRTLGDLRTFGLPPEERVLRRVARSLEEGAPLSRALGRDWEVFN